MADTAAAAPWYSTLTRAQWKTLLASNGGESHTDASDYTLPQASRHSAFGVALTSVGIIAT